MYVGNVILNKVLFIIFCGHVKAKKYWAHIHVIMQKILKICIKRKAGLLLLYMLTAAKILYPQKWKNIRIPTTQGKK